MFCSCACLICYCLSFFFWWKIKVPHPGHPSMRVSVQVPNFGLHFSPVRYRRLMELLDILYRAMPDTEQPAIENLPPEYAPWYPPDLAIEARILVWRVCRCCVNCSHYMNQQWLNIVNFTLFSWFRGLATQLLHGNHVILCYLVYIFMHWTLSCPTVILDAQGACLRFFIFVFILLSSALFLSPPWYGSCLEPVFDVVNPIAWLVSKYLKFLLPISEVPFPVSASAPEEWICRRYASLLIEILSPRIDDHAYTC